MKYLKTLTVVLLFMVSALTAFAKDSYDIKGFYTVTEPERGTKVVSRNGTIDEVEYILSPTKVDTGNYSVEVKKIGNNLYRIKDTDICVETRNCHEFTSSAEKVELIIDSNVSFTKGKIIFD